MQYGWGSRLLAAGLGSLAWAGSSLANESAPEFQSLTEAEQAEFDGPNRLGSEYQSDILTYTKPDEWEFQWLSRERALDFTTGSVSAAHFMMDNRLKVRKHLLDPVEFRFHFTDERSRERESLHHLFELVFWPWQHFAGLSLYTEPSLYKRDDDTGAAIVVQPGERHEIRAFHTFVDVTRLRRNDRKDTHDIDHLPYASGIVGRVWADPATAEHEFLEYAARYETFTRWIFPVEKYEYQYWKSLAWVYARKSLGAPWYASLRFQFDRKHERKFPTDPASTVGADAWRTDRLFVTARGEIADFSPLDSDRAFGLLSHWELVFGAQYAYRRWQADAGSIFYRDLLPHFWLRIPAWPRDKSRDRFGLGYDFTWHRVVGQTGFLAPGDFDGAWEHRLNLSYDIAFNDQAEVRIIATGDLDEFGTRGSWEGGDVQFRLYF